MIELKTLTEAEQHTLLNNLEQTNTIKYSKASYKRPAVKALTKEFGSKYEKEIWVLVTMAATSQRYETNGFRLPLHEQPYITSNKLTKQAISAKKMRVLLVLLDEAGYITFCRGYGISKTQHQRSAIIVKHKLDCMIDRNKSKTQAMARKDQYNIIEVVDIDATTIKKERFEGKLITTKEIAFRNTEGKTFTGLKQKKINLTAYNVQIESSVITVGGVVNNCVIVKRRFEDTLLGCGRYWCGAMQKIGSHISSKCAFTREDIRIDGKECCEADFKTIQPRCLYLEEGVVVDADFDVYDAGLEIDGMTKVEVRNFIKKCMFSILFSADRKAAKGSITTKIRENSLKGVITAEQIVAAMEKHNAPIAHRFYNKTYYRVLQNYEAQMAEFVIDYFTAKGITVLPWHDSFVTKKEHGAELKAMMYKAWEHVMHTTNNCHVDEEFGYELPESEEVAQDILDTQDTLTIEDFDALPPLEAYSDMFDNTQEEDISIPNTADVDYWWDMMNQMEEMDNRPF